MKAAQSLRDGPAPAPPTTNGRAEEPWREAAHLKSPQQPSSRPAGCLPSPLPRSSGLRPGIRWTRVQPGPRRWPPASQAGGCAPPAQGLWASLPPCLLSQARHQWERLGGPFVGACRAATSAPASWGLGAQIGGQRAPGGRPPRAMTLGLVAGGCGLVCPLFWPRQWTPGDDQLKTSDPSGPRGGTWCPPHTTPRPHIRDGRHPQASRQHGTWGLSALMSGSASPA